MVYDCPHPSDIHKTSVYSGTAIFSLRHLQHPQVPLGFAPEIFMKFLCAQTVAVELLNVHVFESHCDLAKFAATSIETCTSTFAILCTVKPVLVSPPLLLVHAIDVYRLGYKP